MGDQDYYSSTAFYLHPQQEKELLLSGGDGTKFLYIGYNDPQLRKSNIRLTGGVEAENLYVGDSEPSSPGWSNPVALKLAGGGHTLKANRIQVMESSSLNVTGGLQMDGQIEIYKSATFSATGPFILTDGHEIHMDDGARLELKEQPAVGWLNRLVYMTRYNPGGQARAIFSDGEYIVDKNGVTLVSVPQPPSVTTPPSASSGGSDGSGGSSGSGGSRESTPLLRKAAGTTNEAAHIIGEPEMRRLMAEATANGWDFVRCSGATPATVTAPAWKLLDGRKFIARTVTDNAVQVQIAFPAPMMAGDGNVSGWVQGAEVDRIRGIFERWFANPLRVVHLDQAGEFGQPVEIAAKVDLNGMDAENLVFYSYDVTTNSYRKIEQPEYWVDKNGYLHFTTALAGDIVVSTGALEKK